jgi:hypothetical protein
MMAPAVSLAIDADAIVSESSVAMTMSVFDVPERTTDAGLATLPI